MARKMNRLTDKQKLAIDAYFSNGFKKAEAMRTAGYSEMTCRIPEQLFKKPQVAAEVERKQKQLAKKYNLNSDWVIKRLMQLAMSGETLAKFKKVQSDGTLAWDFTDATEEDLAVVTELGVDMYTEGRGEDAVEVKKFRVKHPDVQAALTALARHLGLFNDKLELKGSLAKRIQAGRARAFADQSDDTEPDEATVH